jgi:predicted dehydrogenase
MQTRRNFLHASAATAALSRSVLGANDRVRMAIIGTGSRGTLVHEGFTQHNDQVFVAACDVARDRLDQFVTKAGKMATFTDYRKVLEQKDVDAVLITTPDHWHAPIMIAAVEAGKDVYVEKPISNTIEPAQRMVEAVHRTKRIVQVGLQQRSWDHFQESIKLLHK